MKIAAWTMVTLLGFALGACSNSSPQPGPTPQPPAAPAGLPPNHPAPPPPPAGSVQQTPPAVNLQVRPSHVPRPAATPKLTPCDRHEPGWKWQGRVEDGNCFVGPCKCVRE